MENDIAYGRTTEGNTSGHAGVAWRDLREWLALVDRSGELKQILPAWSEERYPLYAYYASRHLPPAKIRAFLDFVLVIAARESASMRRSP